MKKQNIINHVALVVDDSPSMSHLVSKTREVVDAQIKGFQATSKLKGQETRVSVYMFGGTIKCVGFDVPPHHLANASAFVSASISATAMRDAVHRVIHDLGGINTSKGDHSFLVYVITDGEDNASQRTSAEISGLIEGLNDDWTIAAMVPNAAGKHHCKQCGLPPDNIEVWDTSCEKGMEDVGQTIGHTYTAYTMSRSLGMKSTKSLFKFNDVTKTAVKQKLDEIPASDYDTLIVRKYYDGWAIKDFVEENKIPYRVGSAYYQVTKPEKIQAGKNVAVVEKSTGKMFSGSNARKLIGLPTYEVKASPADFDKFDLFVQSTSTNRKLVGNTHLIVFK